MSDQRQAQPGQKVRLYRTTESELAVDENSRTILRASGLFILRQYFALFWKNVFSVGVGIGSEGTIVNTYGTEFVTVSFNVDGVRRVRLDLPADCLEEI